jgi:hypothetical protein
VQARMQIGYQLAPSLEAARGQAIAEACPHWIATRRAMPAFLARAGGLKGGLSPAGWTRPCKPAKQAVPDPAGPEGRPPPC